MLDPKTNHSYSGVLTVIANYLCTRLNTRIQKSTGKTYYIIEVSSLAGVVILTDYLNSYTLLTGKLLDFLDWYKVAQHRINKTHYTENALNETAATLAFGPLLLTPQETFGCGQRSKGVSKGPL